MIARFILISGWFVLENSYFGWHVGPQSIEELAADGLLFVLGMWAVVTLD